MKKIILLLTFITILSSTIFTGTVFAERAIWRESGQKGPVDDWYINMDTARQDTLLEAFGTLSNFDTIVPSDNYRVFVDDNSGNIWYQVYYSVLPFEVYLIETDSFDSYGNRVYRYGLIFSSENQVIYRHLSASGNPSSRNSYRNSFEDLWSYPMIPLRKGPPPEVTPQSEIDIAKDDNGKFDSVTVNWAGYVKAKVYLNDKLIKETEQYAPPVINAFTQVFWYQFLDIVQPSVGTNTIKVVFTKTDSTEVVESKTFTLDGSDLPGSGGGSGKAPVIPTKPSTVNIIDWLIYLVEWVIYPFEVVGWMFSKLFGAIGDVFNSSTGFIKTLTAFFSFLPAELISVLVVGLIVAVILRVFGR